VRHLVYSIEVKYFFVLVHVCLGRYKRPGEYVAKTNMIVVDEHVVEHGSDLLASYVPIGIEEDDENFVPSLSLQFFELLNSSKVHQLVEPF